MAALVPSTVIRPPRMPKRRLLATIRATLGPGISINAAVGARWSTEADEPFALDEAQLTSPGKAPAASEHNPFAWTLLLIVFAGLTAFFAGKRSGGRGLIGA